MMMAKHAWYSKRCPYMLIVQLADGSKWWCRMIPARHLTEQDLEPLPRSYHCIRDYELSAIEAEKGRLRRGGRPALTMAGQIKSPREAGGKETYLCFAKMMVFLPICSK